MNKTIVDIERISVFIPKPNIAKSGFYNLHPVPAVNTPPGWDYC
jgi:hypothetical protein